MAIIPLDPHPPSFCQEPKVKAVYYVMEYYFHGHGKYWFRNGHFIAAVPEEDAKRKAKAGLWKYGDKIDVKLNTFNPL